MLLWTTIKQKNLQICIDHAPSYIHFCKKKRMQEVTWSLYVFFHNQNYQGGTSKVNASILDNKQLLSNMLDHKATQVPYTSIIAFNTDSYVFCSSFSAIYSIIATASLAILLYEGSTFEQKSQ